MAFGLSGLARQQRRTDKFTQRHEASPPHSAANLPILKLTWFDQPNFLDSKFNKIHTRNIAGTGRRQNAAAPVIS
jgi:hypothetical protein